MLWSLAKLSKDNPEKYFHLNMQESKTRIHTTSPLYLPSSWISCLQKHPRNAITQFTAILLMYQLYTFLGSRHTHKPNTDSTTFLQDIWGKQESQKELEIRKTPTIFTLKDRYIQVNSALTCPADNMPLPSLCQWSPLDNPVRILDQAQDPSKYR